MPLLLLFKRHSALHEVSHSAASYKPLICVLMHFILEVWCVMIVDVQTERERPTTVVVPFARPSDPTGDDCADVNACSAANRRLQAHFNQTYHHQLEASQIKWP
jgi:hypothetical protein